MMRRLLAAVLVVAFAAPAFGEPTVLMEQEQAPFSGVLLPEPDAIKTSELLQEAEFLRRKVSALEATVNAQAEQVVQLERALVRATMLDELQQRSIAVRDQSIALQRAMMEEYRALLEQSRRTIELDQVAIARLEKRIESLERRAFWERLLGPLAFLAGIFAGGYGGAIVR